MKKILQKLADIADSLDKKSQHQLADEVDLIIRKYSSQQPAAFEGFKNLSADGGSRDEIPIDEDSLNYARIAEKIMSGEKNSSEDESKEE